MAVTFGCGLFGKSGVCVCVCECDQKRYNILIPPEVQATNNFKYVCNYGGYANVYIYISVLLSIKSLDTPY